MFFIYKDLNHDSKVLLYRIYMYIFFLQIIVQVTVPLLLYTSSKTGMSMSVLLPQNLDQFLPNILQIIKMSLFSNVKKYRAL